MYACVLKVALIELVTLNLPREQFWLHLESMLLLLEDFHVAACLLL